MIGLVAELALALAVLWLVGVVWHLRRLVNSLEERQHYLMSRDHTRTLTGSPIQRQALAGIKLEGGP